MKKHEDAKMDKAAMSKLLKAHADKPASKAHKGLAKGGMVARGGGAVTKKSALRFVKNG